MKRKSWMLVGAAVIALALIAGIGAAVVYAQSPTPTAPTGGPMGPGGPGGPGHGDRNMPQAVLDAAAKALGMTSDDLKAQLDSGKTLQEIASAKGVDFNAVMQAMQAARPVMLGPAGLDAAAKALGMSPDELATQLKDGKTLQDLATAHGVSLQSLQDAIKAAHEAEMTAQIKQAVTDGKMDQGKADWLLEGLSKGYLDGPGGFGFGFRRGPGFGGPGPNGGQPPAQSAPTTTP